MQQVVELSAIRCPGFSPDIHYIKRLRNMATIAIPAKLTVVYIIFPMAISTHGRHIDSL